MWKELMNALKTAFVIMAILSLIAGYGTGNWTNFIISIIFPIVTFGTVPFLKLMFRKFNEQSLAYPHITNKGR